MDKLDPQLNNISAKAKKQFSTKELVLISLMAAVIAITSWITVPIGAVPFTLQTMGVMTTLVLLGGRNGTMSIVIYICLGVIGLPVFAGFKSGTGVLLGLTGGYIIGFIFMGLFYWFITAHFGKNHIARASGLLGGLTLCYIFGTLWFMLVWDAANGAIAVDEVLKMCVTPFLLPEAAKIIMTYIITNRIAGALNISY